jgi:hypothetical protein
VSAQTLAQTEGLEDPFVAQLLGVLGPLSNLVLFRVTLDKYRQSPNILPRPEVFVRVFRKHGNGLALEIARTWQLSPASLGALEEQCRESSPSQMTALGRAVYFGQLAGSLAVATHHSLYSKAGAHAILVEQGLAPEVASTLLKAGQDADI